MKKVRKFSMRKFLLFLVVLIIIISISLFGIYEYSIGPVGSDKSPIEFTVKKGDNYYNIAKELKAKKLIKSEQAYKIYIKINKPTNLTFGDYELNKSMSIREIINVLSDSKNQKVNTTKVTFREGLNISSMAKKVSEVTSVSEEEFIKSVSDKEYIKKIQPKYWFLTDDIYNEQIYYPLEGYLFPDTYYFEEKTISAEKIIEKMLDNTKDKLEKYKTDLQSKELSIHQILTLASLIEQEAVTKDDRALVSSVFYNRLNSNISLGSDVTTYYAARKNLTESLTQQELDSCNGYNTRCKTMKGLPVGPISNPSLGSIEAALNPATSDYYYFVADSSKKVYFNKTLNEHNQTVAKLKKEGKWAA